MPLLSHSILKEFPFIFSVCNHFIQSIPNSFQAVCVTLSNARLLQDVEILKANTLAMKMMSFVAFIYLPTHMALVIFFIGRLLKLSRRSCISPSLCRSTVHQQFLTTSFTEPFSSDLSVPPSIHRHISNHIYLSLAITARCFRPAKLFNLTKQTTDI